MKGNITKESIKRINQETKFYWLVEKEHGSTSDLYGFLSVIQIPLPRQSLDIRIGSTTSTDLRDWHIAGVSEYPVPFISALEWNVAIKDKKNKELAATLFCIADHYHCTIEGIAWRKWMKDNYVKAYH